jgi:hypothetical protein
MKIIKKHIGDSVTPANYTAETKRLYDFTADVRSKPEVLAALRGLAQLDSFERMAELNIEFDRTFMLRNRHQAETERIDVCSIRHECDKAITAVWHFIDFYCRQYGEELYRPLLARINNLNSYYKQQLAARSSRRRNRQNPATEKPIVPPTE